MAFNQRGWNYKTRCDMASAESWAVGWMALGVSPRLSAPVNIEATRNLSLSLFPPPPFLSLSPHPLEVVTLRRELVLLGIAVDCNRRAGNLVAEGAIVAESPDPPFPNPATNLLPCSTIRLMMQQCIVNYSIFYART